MPSLDSCINDIFEPGNIPADPGTTTTPTFPDIRRNPAAANLTLSAIAPDVVRTVNILLSPAQANLTLSGTAPTSAISVNALLSPAQANLALTTSAPTLDVGTTAFTFEGAIAKNTADKTTQNYSAGVAMTFSAEDADTTLIHDTSSNTGRLTIPAGLNGKYGVIHANVTLALLGGDQDYWCIINKSGGGNANFVGAGMRANQNDTTVHGGTTYFAVQTHPVLLTTADYYEVSVYCNDTSVTLVAASTAFSIYVVG